MSFLAKFRPKTNYTKLLVNYFGEEQKWKTEEGNTVILSKLVNAIRPRKWRKNDTIDLTEFLLFLQENKSILEQLKEYLISVTHGKRFYRILTDADIIQDVSFIYELKQRLIAQFIPNQPDYESLEYVLAQVFYVDFDAEWVNAIPEDQLVQLFHILSSTSNSVDLNSELNPRRQLIFSIEVLANRISGAAMETEVNKMVPEYASYENPFLNFQRELNLFLAQFREDPYKTVDKEDIDYKQLLVLHGHCKEFINSAYKNTNRFGISIRVNQYLLRIQQQLDRLKDLLLLFLKTSNETNEKKSLDLILYLIRVNYRKNNIRELLNKSTQRVASEITLHKAKSGEHYITKDKEEYRKMLHASLGGGGIVGIMCIIKVLLSKAALSPFGMAFLYSTNYALGFILIYLLGYTLATKQPAMTASSFVKSLEEGSNTGKKKKRYRSFAILFARLFRSQFIAFVGNVFMAFPIALIGVWVIDLLLDYNIAEQKADKLINDLHPIHSLAILHASIAGIYLFLSGVIAGNVSNRIKHNKIAFRIQEHPVLKAILGRKRTKKIADFHAKKYPGIMSNLWFGVFMGSTASIGYFVGLNIDIRHITFASGNLALGLYGASWSITISTLLWAILGIGIIGLLNFIVSFTLSIIVAMRSCGIRVRELRYIFSSIVAYFFEKPLHFFFPLEVEEMPVEEVDTAHDSFEGQEK